MQAHLSSGNRDLRRTTYQEMKRLGVPLDIPRSEVGNARAKGSRPDTSYVLGRLHDFIRRHPDCSHDAREHERSRLFEEWDSLGPAGREAFIAGQRTPSTDALDMEMVVEIPPSLEHLFMAHGPFF